MQLSVLCGPGHLSDFRNVALVVAHPGHELKVFGWLAECRPRAHVITDGSGGGTARLHSTAKLLNKIGATAGEVFGPVSDAEFYRAILETRIPFFLRLVDRLAASLVEQHTDFVAGDASEGFNPTHDLCRALLNAAISIAERTMGSGIANFEFCLTEWEQHCRESHDDRCWHLRLDNSRLREKLSAAADYIELKAEIQQAIKAKGEEYFRIECFKRVMDPLAAPLCEVGVDCKPYYETHGEERVAQDKYTSVIRYQEHIVPILAAVRSHAVETKKISSLHLVSRAAGVHP